MVKDHFIQCRVSAETKAALRAAAERQQITESALLKRMIDLSLVAGVGIAERAEPLPAPPGARKSRLSVRVHPGDVALLAARAEARQMPPATYVSRALRAHLRGIAPIPKAELAAFTEAIRKLGEIHRLLLAIHATWQSHAANKLMPSAQNVRSMLLVCEALSNGMRHLLAANLKSWTTGEMRK